MTEADIQVPSAHEISRIVFGDDIRSVVSVADVFSFVIARLEQGRDRGSIEEIEYWENHAASLRPMVPEQQ